MVSEGLNSTVAVEARTRFHGSIEDLARAHSPELLRLAFNILRDRGEADDAVQDALLLAWKSWDSVLDPSRCSAWLM
ncbi:MAG: RNA polymerase sigma factor [Candidatus Dormibacteraceae bacterium]